MTEKRFTLICFDDLQYYDFIEDNGKVISTNTVVSLLNRLNDENEQLQADLRMCREKGLYWQNKAKDIFGDMKTNVELQRENVQLKQENEGLKSSNMEYEDIFGRLEEENEQLKSALKELKEIGDYQTNHIKELQEELQPIQDICKKYKIPLEDLPDVLEEYITLDNEEYEEKLKERTI